MREFTKKLALFLIAVMLLSVTAFATPSFEVTTEIKSYGDTTVTLTKDTSNNDVVTVTVIGAGIVEGEYLVLMVNGDATDINDETILYIDQKPAVVSDGKGTIEFEMKPSALRNGVVMITGLSSGEGGKKAVVAVIIDGAVALGDINGDGIIDLKDLTRFARYLAFDKTATIAGQDIADTNNDGVVDLKDLTRLARYIATAGNVELG